MFFRNLNASFVLFTLVWVFCLMQGILAQGASSGCISNCLAATGSKLNCTQATPQCYCTANFLTLAKQCLNNQACSAAEKSSGIDTLSKVCPTGAKFGDGPNGTVAGLSSVPGSGGSPTSGGLASTASSGSGGSGSNSSASSPHAESSMALALLLALISGSLSLY